MPESKILDQYPNYVIYDDGRVYSLIRKRFMKPSRRKDGYLQIGLRMLVDGKIIKKAMLLHRLIAMAFVPNPRNVGYVNHIDGNKENIHPLNLEWCTGSENQKHAYRTGLKKIPDYHKAALASLPSIRKSVIQYDSDGNFIKRFESITVASQETGIQVTSICQSCKQKNHLAGGFIWCYEKQKNAIKQALEKKRSGYGKKKVYQFDLNGTLLKVWNSAQDVEKETGMAASTISIACSGKIAQVYGYIWSRKEDISDKINSGQMKRSKQKNIKIDQYSMDGTFIRSWDSIKDASHSLLIDGSGISKVCKGKQKQSGGFKWKYKICRKTK